MLIRKKTYWFLKNKHWSKEQFEVISLRLGIQGAKSHSFTIRFPNDLWVGVLLRSMLLNQGGKRLKNKKEEEGSSYYVDTREEGLPVFLVRYWKQRLGQLEPASPPRGEHTSDSGFCRSPRISWVHHHHRHKCNYSKNLLKTCLPALKQRRGPAKAKSDTLSFHFVFPFLRVQSLSPKKADKKFWNLTRQLAPLAAFEKEQIQLGISARPFIPDSHIHSLIHPASIVASQISYIFFLRVQNKRCALEPAVKVVTESRDKQTKYKCC